MIYSLLVSFALMAKIWTAAVWQQQSFVGYKLDWMLAPILADL